MSSVTDQVAILTGDFIGSTTHAPESLDRGFARLSELCALLENWHDAPTRLTRYRGDGWQAWLARPDLALRSALFVQAGLRMTSDVPPTRLCAGLGAVTRPGGATLSDADGPAFHAAGRGLDAMPRGRRLDMTGSVSAPLRAAAALADVLARRWSVPQAEALVLALPPDAPTQNEIASSLGITQQSVSERLDAAGFGPLSDALDLIETREQACEPVS